MTKNIECGGCSKKFAVIGNWGTTNPVKQGITCPHCGQPSEVQWPRDGLFKAQKP